MFTNPCKTLRGAAREVANQPSNKTNLLQLVNIHSYLRANVSNPPRYQPLVTTLLHLSTSLSSPGLLCPRRSAVNDGDYSLLISSRQQSAQKREGFGV